MHQAALAQGSELAGHHRQHDVLMAASRKDGALPSDWCWGRTSYWRIVVQFKLRLQEQIRIGHRIVEDGRDSGAWISDLADQPPSVIEQAAAPIDPDAGDLGIVRPPDGDLDGLIMRGNWSACRGTTDP